MLFSIFSKITRRDVLIQKRDTSIYVHILFPIAVAFLITFGGARLLSHYYPEFFIEIVNDLHIHHFAYGIIVLVLSGYLALVNSSPRAKYLIALLHGFGLGLAFDEFGIWLRLSADNSARWSYDGVILLTALFFMVVSAESGVRFWRHHFGRKQS